MRKSLLIRWLFLLLIALNIPDLVRAQSFGLEPLRECWNLGATETLRDTKIASDNENTLFIPLTSGVVKAVDVKTGATVWQSELGGDIFGSLIYERGNLYAASYGALTGVETSPSRNLSVTSLSSLTGITQWREDFEITTETDAVYTLTNHDSDQLYVIGNGGQLFSVAKKTGTIVFKKSLNTRLTAAPVLQDGKIYLGAADHKILAVALAGEDHNVEEIKRLSDAPTILSSGGADGTHKDVLYVGDKLGQIISLDLQNSHIDWKSRTGGAISDITETGNKLIVASADNYVYLLSAKNGERIWKKRLAGNNYGNTPTASGIAVFSPLGDRNVTFIELNKGKTVNQLMLNADAENSFIYSPLIVGDSVIFSTLQGFYAFSAKMCS